jgi:hypothetical protein
MKISVIYCYYEKNDEYKENFKRFLKNIRYTNKIDYYIILNGECTCSADIPSFPSVRVFFRENKGFDFGGWSYGVNRLVKEYDYYFFINTSVSGPYGYDDERWVDAFIQLFSENIKLVGTSINVLPVSSIEEYDLEKIYGHPAPFSHVQSMFFAIDNEYKKYLDSVGFFEEEQYNKMDADGIVVHAELGLSQLAFKNGWNINCILSEYRGRDYLTIKEDPNETSYNGDPYYPNRYFGKTIQPEEVIFFKSWRMSDVKH